MHEFRHSAALVLVAISFTTSTLFVGDPFDEPTSRGLSARGLGSGERRMLRRRHRARTLGFGVATQLCFLVPFGAVVTMPAAVAGSTLLGHSLLEQRAPGNATDTRETLRRHVARPGWLELPID
ncbi:MAG: hypothetical protein QM622_01035 [Microbacterium sp.]